MMNEPTGSHTLTPDVCSGPGGLLLVDKPTGMTSHDVVATIRRLVRPCRVGHTGTLDPIASGLLVLCLGPSTRLSDFIESMYKVYRAVALLGMRTDTQDITGSIIAETPVEEVSGERVCEIAESFVGAIEQIPPAFSALKVKGVRAYKLARRREPVELKPRTVQIRRFEIEHVQSPRVDFLVECSKGTYVRTLCNDLGEALGIGGCMESLRRLTIGSFSVDDSVPLADLDTREAIEEALIPPSRALTHLPGVACSSEQAIQITHGMTVTVSGDITIGDTESPWAQALGPEGDLIAVGRLSRKGGELLFHPKRVLVRAEDI